MKHFDPRELTKATGHPDRLRREHAERLAECAPLLGKEIPLGIPAYFNWQAIRRYYQQKHSRGEYGRFFFHHCQGSIKQNVLRG